MNKIIHFSFSEWLSEQEQLEESIHTRLRPTELGHIDQNAHMIEPNDLIELGVNTQFRGQKVPKYGKVVSVSGQRVMVEPMAGGKPVEMKLGDLYPVNADDMPYGHQQQLQALGAKNLWQKRTNKQRVQDVKKQQSMERQKAAEPKPYETPEISRSDIKRVKNILMGGDEPLSTPEPSHDNPLSALFGQDPAQPPSKVGKPALGSFVQNRGGEFGRLSTLFPKPQN